MAEDFLPGDDGLPIGEVGAWTRDKHALLRRYVGISAGVRAEFTGPGKAGAPYIDLFCGPGYCRVRDEDEVLPGSALVAALSAAERKQPFSAIHVGDAAEVARKIVAGLNPFALHLVFLDPFNLGGLSMPLIEAFAPLKRIDLLMHVSAMDLQRNLEQAIASDASHHFDSFAPGWRDQVDQQAPSHTVRRRIVATRRHPLGHRRRRVRAARASDGFGLGRGHPRAMPPRGRRVLLQAMGRRPQAPLRPDAGRADLRRDARSSEGLNGLTARPESGRSNRHWRRRQRSANLDW